MRPRIPILSAGVFHSMTSLFAYLDALRKFAGRKLWVGLALTGAGALLEGVGVLSLVPLFSLVVGQPGEGPASAAIGWMQGIGLATPLSQAIALGCAFLALIALRGVLQWLRDMHTRRLGLEFVDAWRQRAFAAVSAAPWQVLMGKRRTDIEHSITVDISRLSQGTNQLLGGTVQVAMVIVQVAVIALIAPMMLVVALGLLAVAAGLGLPVIRKAGLQGKRSTLAGRNVHHVLGSFMAGQKLARLHDAQGMFAGQMNRTMQEARDWQLEFAASQALVRASLQWLSALCVVGMLLLGYFAFQIDLARLIVVTLVLMRIAAPAISLVQTAQTTANMLPAFAALKTLMAELSATPEDAPRARTTEAAPEPNRDARSALVEVEDIWFAYGSDDWTLRGVSMRVDPHEIVALHAPSGAGKTTLLDVLTGLLPAARGEMRVHGQVLRSVDDWRAWRQKVAYLPQDPFLFDTTIRENLLWFTPAANEAEIAHALAMAGADEVLRRCPQGLDTRVGERGQAFSGGERQRLCLARALLRRSDLLILDEATSAIDEDAGSRIVERLRDWRDRPAILLASHRAETRALADRIVPLEGGMTARPPTSHATSGMR